MPHEMSWGDYLLFSFGVSPDSRTDCDVDNGRVP